MNERHDRDLTYTYGHYDANSAEKAPKAFNGLKSQLHLGTNTTNEYEFLSSLLLFKWISAAIKRDEPRHIVKITQFRLTCL